MRRIAVWLVLVVLAVVLVAPSVFATGTKEEHPSVFKVGFLSSLSGALAGFAETQRKSFIFAVEEVNNAGGLNMPWGKVKVETFIADDESKLDVGVRRYREFVEKGVVALTGGIWNPMSAALNEECKLTPIIYIPGYVPAMDAFKKGNPAVCTFTPTFTPWSIGYVTGQAVIQTLGKKTIYYVERADSWGSTIREGLEAACAKFGGRIIGVDQVSLGTPDYSPIITKAIKAHPDAFVTSLAGGDAIANLKQAYDMGLYDKTLMFNCWTANVVAKGIPDKALENLYALVWFYYDLEGLHDPALVAKVKAHSDAFWKRWNEPPDNMGTACYVAMQFIFRAVEKTGTFDPAVVANYLMNNKVDTVKGPQQFRADRQPLTDNMCFLLRGKAASEKRNEWDYFEVLDSYGGDEALPSLASMGY